MTAPCRIDDINLSYCLVLRVFTTALLFTIILTSCYDTKETKFNQVFTLKFVKNVFINDYA